MKQMSNSDLTSTIECCFAIVCLVGFAYVVSWIAFRIAVHRSKNGKGK